MIVNILYYLGGLIKMADIMAGMWDFVVRKQLTNHLGPSVKGTILDLDETLVEPFLQGLEQRYRYQRVFAYSTVL
jgi:hypothetical protein